MSTEERLANAASYELGAYRPPSEAYSLLLRLTRNCPWNRCTFCEMYKSQKFELRSVEEIKQDIDTIKNIHDRIKEMSLARGWGGRTTRSLAEEICSNGAMNECDKSVAVWMYFGGRNAFIQDAHSLAMNFDGFLEFSQFLIENNIPFKIEFSSKDDLIDISGCLDPYEEYLTRALTSLPADSYLRAITFMRQAPKLLQYLSVFVKFLKNPDPLSLEPEVSSLYLTSQTNVDEKPPLLNPFAPSITAREIREFDPLFKHRVAAAAIGIAGLAYLSTAYLYERNLIAERYREMAILEVSPPARYDQKMHELLPIAYMQQHPMPLAFLHTLAFLLAWPLWHVGG